MISKEPISSSEQSRIVVVGAQLPPRAPESVELIELALYAETDQEDSKLLGFSGDEDRYFPDTLMVADDDGQGFRAWQLDESVNVIAFVAGVYSKGYSFTGHATIACARSGGCRKRACWTTTCAE